jgi:hypothetical protein
MAALYCTEKAEDIGRQLGIQNPNRKSKIDRRRAVMGWIDADAHVVESAHTWDYLTPSENKFVRFV